MDNSEKLETQGTQDEDKQNKLTTISVGHHHTQRNTNNVRHDSSYKQYNAST